MIEARNLGIRFDGRWIFRHLEITLGIGDVLAVSGANGSGKSTLLRLLAGLARPSEGHYQVPEPVNTSVGYAALETRLYPALTVREHLELAASLRGIIPNTSEWIERIGLVSASDRASSRLSTGMRSRLKLALAAQASPKLLLLDEPAAGLDGPGRELLANLVRDQAARGIVVLATNEQFELGLATHKLHLEATS